MGGGKLSVALLGGFELRDADGTPLPLPSAAARSVIAFLALHPDRLLSRDLVAGRLWPDESNDAARANLRQALFAAKEAAGIDPFVRPTGSIGLDRDRVRVDVDEFLTAIERAATATDADERLVHLDTAVDLYRGDLLDGFYEGPTDVQPEALRRQYVGALERLVDLHIAARREDTALVLARKLVVADPWAERSHRKVMWLAATTGRFHEAIRQYQACVKVLEEELGTEPSFETVDLHDSIVRERETGRLRAFAPDLPLVGRDHERTSVAAALDSLTTGTGGVVLVEGDTGMGKTRLLDAIAADATWRRLDVRSLRGLTDSPPYGAVIPVVDALDPADVADLDDATRRRIEALRSPVTPGPARFDDHAAMHDAAARGLAAPPRRPVVVIVDDAHDLDAASAAVVGRLADLTTEEALLLVVAYRHDAARRGGVWEVVTAIDRIPHRIRISLGPLTPGQTEALARAVAGHEIAPDAAMDLHAATGGVPYLVVEALRDPASQPASEPLGGAVRSVTAEFLRHRTADLDREALQTLHLLALLGRPASPELLRALGGSGLRDLTARGLVSVRDGFAEVANDLARELIVESLDRRTTVDLHRRLAETLEDVSPDDADAIARHLLAGGDHERAAPYLIEAAERALAVHEYRDALARLRNAAEALPPDHGGLLDVRRRIFEILDLLGERDAQDEALRHYEELAEGPDAIDALRLRARWLADGDDFDTARTTAHEALDRARSASDPGREVAALTTLAWIECLAGDAVRGAALLDEASGFGDVGMREQADARNALGQNLVDLQRDDEAETQLLAAKALYADLNEPRGEIEVVGMLAAIQVHRGNTDRAIEMFEWAVDRSLEIGYREGEAKNLANLGVALALDGSVARSLNALDQAADALRALNRQTSYLSVRLNAATIRSAVLGADLEAQQAAIDSLSWARSLSDLRAEGQAEALLGSIASRQGDWSQAEESFSRSVRLAHEAKDIWLETQHRIEFARAALKTDRPAVARDLLDHALRQATSCGFADLLSEARITLAELALAEGQPEVAHSILGDVESAPPIAPFRLSHVSSEACRALGKHTEADAQLDRAWTQLQALLDPFDASETEVALSAVPDMKSLVESWKAYGPTYSQIQALPKSVGPREHITNDDYVSVQVVRSRPTDLRTQPKGERRRMQVRRVLKTLDSLELVTQVDALCDVFGVSDKTMRRDLSTLREEHGPQVSTRGSLAREK